jgi:hypothetical protein
MESKTEMSDKLRPHEDGNHIPKHVRVEFGTY